MALNGWLMNILYTLSSNPFVDQRPTILILMFIFIYESNYLQLKEFEKKNTIGNQCCKKETVSLPAFSSHSLLSVPLSPHATLSISAPAPMTTVTRNTMPLLALSIEFSSVLQTFHSTLTIFYSVLSKWMECYKRHRLHSRKVVIFLKRKAYNGWMIRRNAQMIFHCKRSRF